MPELPEVETIVRSLRPGIVGRVIERAELLFKPLLRRPPRAGLSVLAGQRIAGARRRGKMAIIDCQAGLSLVFHLKMTGQLVLVDKGEARDRHTRLVLSFQDGGPDLRFRDVRKFGFLLCLSGGGAESCAELSGLGPEPLDLALEDFVRTLCGRKGRIKSLLINQEVIAGIGNIYADEILFDSGIHPETPASALSKESVARLWGSIRKILSLAIDAKGSTLRDYVDADGKSGSFQFFHKVYDRKGQPCVNCGRPIKKTAVGGRGTYFCPRCQRRRRGKAVLRGVSKKPFSTGPCPHRMAPPSD